MKNLITTLLLIFLLTFSSFAQIQGEGHPDFADQDEIDSDPNDFIHPNEGPLEGEGHEIGDHSKCTHDSLNIPEPELLHVDEPYPPTESESEGRVLASASTFRIYPYYGFLAPAYYKTYFQNRLGPAIVSYFEHALKVKYPVSGKLKSPSSFKTICGKTIPSVLKTGVSADFFLMFDSQYDQPASSTASTWVAETYSCYLAAGSKRPLIGKSVLNRAVLKDPGTNVLLHEKNIYMMLHEITHALGFSSSLYKYFLDANGKVRSGHVSKVGSATVLNVSPLTTRLRSYFGCSSLKGAYMENSGSSATAGSHFERRHYPYEAMTSGLIYQQAYSQFTLAVLEGSGWYVPNYSYADPYWLGQGNGCNFLFGTCSPTYFDEWCSGSSRGCTPMGRGGGSCSSDIRSDGCRFVHSNVNYDCENPSAKSYARLPSLQTFGRTANSKCFSGTLSTSSGASKSSFCFKYTCSGSGANTKVLVTIGSKSYTCSRKGSLSVSGYKGYIDCPNPQLFCSTVGAKTCPRGCMGRGSCVNGKCVCNKGYSGKDCAA